MFWSCEKKQKEDKFVSDADRLYEKALRNKKIIEQKYEAVAEKYYQDVLVKRIEESVEMGEFNTNNWDEKPIVPEECDIDAMKRVLNSKGFRLLGYENVPVGDRIGVEFGFTWEKTAIVCYWY